MGWWDAKGGGVIGDEPADALGEALREAAARPRRLDELLADLAAALERRSAAVTAVPAPLRLRVTLRDGSMIAPATDVDDDAVSVLARALDQVANAYELAWERAPTLVEVLETLAFVLGPGMEDIGIPRVRRVEVVP